MEEICEDDIQELTIDRFEKTYSTLSKKPGSKYKFIMKGGQAVKAALFRLCQVVWQTEKQPQTWERSSLVQLYKGKGPRSILDNMRHIHCKDEFPKFFGHLVVSASKDKMISNLTKYQIATKPGHRAQEHLFVLKSVIALYMMYDKAVILSMWDLSKFFDRESLSDCLNELYKSNVHGKLYRLLYTMNKNTRISVQTPVGTTDERDTGEGVGQGTLEGALVSAVNLDSGVNEHFHDSEYEISYGQTTLQPILFQDDVARLSLDLESVQMGNNKMEAMAESKLLNYNLDKSCFIVMGNKKTRQVIHTQLETSPLLLCGADMKQETQAKYLGDWLTCHGLSDSVTITVKKRKGLVSLSIYEIRSVIEDCRSQVCGGLSAGLDIWELAVLPKLLYNSDCWMDISTDTLKELEDIQLTFYRCLLAVGSGCPLPSLYWETGGTLMKNRILQKKLLFLHHVATLPNDTLAREVYEVQAKLELPGLLKECKEFLVINGITNLSLYSKLQWKSFVIKKIKSMNKDDILNMMKKPYKKISHQEHVNEKFEVQPYLKTMNLSQARMRFKLKTGMTPTVQMNFPSSEEFANQLWTCVGCTSTSSDTDRQVEGRRDTQAHIMVCPGYTEFRQNLDLENDKDLVTYFGRVVKKRLETEEDEEC